MLAGLALGKWAPSAVQALRSMEFGKGSQVNVPIAVLIWLMIIDDEGGFRRHPERPSATAVAAGYAVREAGKSHSQWL